MRANYNTDDPETFYRQAIYIPCVDGLQQKLQEKFNEHFKVAAQIQLIVPRNVASTTFADIEQTVNFYNRDIDCEATGNEFARWKKKWERIPERERPGSAIDTLAAIMKLKKTFTQIYTHYSKFWLLFLSQQLLLQKKPSGAYGA